MEEQGRIERQVEIDPRPIELIESNEIQTLCVQAAVERRGNYSIGKGTSLSNNRVTRKSRMFVSYDLDKGA